jgi:ATP-dependent exoDNAse (exonuclease V) alpha subunit
MVNSGRVIDRDFGHLTHGYVLTSHASQGDTVDKILVAISSQSLPATNERTAYVALTRGREKAVVFTDDRIELLKAASRPDDPMSATELAGSAEQAPTLLDRLKKLAFTRNLVAAQKHRTHNRGLDHAG